MAETFFPGLHSVDARRAAAEAVVALLDRWGIDEDQKGALLGVEDVGPYRQGEPLPDDPDTLARAGHLLAIERALRKRYADDPMMRENWVRFPNPELGDFTPLLVMLGGPEGLARAREAAESPTGGAGAKG